MSVLYWVFVYFVGWKFREVVELKFLIIEYMFEKEVDYCVGVNY